MKSTKTILATMLGISVITGMLHHVAANATVKLKE